MNRHLIIGTRGSHLALIQAKLVAAEVTRLEPGLTTELKIIITTGDNNHAPIPTEAIGKTWFTAEIEDALLAHTIDLAVHSLKDLPPETPAGLISMSVLKRADPRDVLISKTGAPLAKLPPQAVIGTDSLRRTALLLHRRPDLKVASLRGNVETRLRKLAEGGYDAIVVAAAGLERLGLINKTTEFLDPSWFVPAVGQGVLAVEIAQRDTELKSLLGRLQHAPTLAAVAAEQAFSRVIGGGCKLPVSCYADIKDDHTTLYTVVADSDGRNARIKTTAGPTATATEAAQQLARELMAAHQTPL